MNCTIFYENSFINSFNEKWFEIPTSKDINSLEKANARINELKGIASTLGIDKYFAFSEPVYNSETGRYDYSWRVAPAVLLTVINEILDKGLTLALISNYGSLCPTYFATLIGMASSFSSGMDGITEAHMPEAYMTLVNYFNNK